MDKNLENVLKETKWWENINDLFADVCIRNKKIEDIVLPTNNDEKKYYTEKLEYLMSHNQEKYRDRDGKVAYEKLRQIIETLKS